MREFSAGSYDVAVIGAGHAGIEASLACARLGMKTVCFTINLDAVGNMPCNPAIGGTGKGHLVRELDALGGEMARAADLACIQYRMLNRGKGPAVWSLRAQADRRRYQEIMKETLETQENLVLHQAEIVSIGLTDGHVSSVTTHTGAVYAVRAVVIATGTYLGGRTIVGDVVRTSGPDGLAAATELTKCLADMGLCLRRFKTGTPPRVNARSVRFDEMQLQPGDEEIEPFSYSTDAAALQNRAVCWLTYTKARTHEIIRANLDRSPLFNGTIESTGPRYCPSIETKIVTFPDKERHQLFIEPMGLHTQELYIQGLSSSLPEDVQIDVVRSIPGLENAEMQRCAYAIEYDCVDPTELRATLESKKIPGLYGAGQFNGSSGYEEAAVQGFVAGVNAALKIRGEEPLILRRSDGYIGTLIDDLVTKGTEEPYRIMTSRSEYRLLLRQDNADARLTPYGHRVGLVDDRRYAAFLEKAGVDALIIADMGAAALIREKIPTNGRTNPPPSQRSGSGSSIRISPPARRSTRCCAKKARRRSSPARRLPIFCAARRSNTPIFSRLTRSARRCRAPSARRSPSHSNTRAISAASSSRWRISDAWRIGPSPRISTMPPCRGSAPRRGRSSSPYAP